MKFVKFTKIIVILSYFSILLLQSKETDNLYENNQLLNQIEIHLEEYEGEKAEKKILQFFTQKELTNKTQIGMCLYYYGKLIFFGLQTSQIPQLKISYFYFRLSAEFGNPQALYMLSVFSNYQLDGSFNVLVHLKENFQSVQIDEHLRQKLYSYANERRFTQMMLNLYYSNQQGVDEAALSLGYRYFKGIGVGTNCSTAALYYEEICNKLFLETEDIYHPLSNKKHRLDHEIYQKQQQQSILDYFVSPAKLQILENIVEVQRKTAAEIINLGYYYFYGLGGLKKNYEKAFEMFEKVYNEKQDKSHYAKRMLGFMHLDGLGTIKNYTKAKLYFLQGANKNDSGSFNGLAYMNKYGLGVNQNMTQAIQYFFKSASLGDSEGMYNYGSMLLMPSTQYLQRDVNLGYQYINKAAQQGYYLAQYSVGLMLLDGINEYSNCQKAVGMLKAASQFSKWKEYMKKGHEFFANNKLKFSFVNYLMAAMLGEEVGILNAGILIDKNQFFSDFDTNYDQLENDLEQDNLFKIIKNKKNIIKFFNLYAFLFDDYLQILKTLKIEERYKILKILISVNKNSSKNINKYIAYKCFSLSYTDFPYSSLKLGDYAYYGLYDKKNYKDAFIYYYIASQFKTNDSIVAQSYYNLGFMAGDGQGVKADFFKSNQFFNYSITKYPELSYFSPYEFILKIIKVSFVWDKMSNSEFFEIALEYIQDLQIEDVMSITAFHFYVILSLLIVLGLLFGIKLRLKNANGLYHNEDINNNGFNNSQ